MAQKKEYRSAIRSRTMIQRAFQELLREKPFEKITVTDIVNRADINRSTFYAHYPDVRGLVEALMDNVVQKSIDLVANMDFQEIFADPSAMLRGLLEIGMENLEVYRLLSHSDFALRQTECLKAAFLEKAVSELNIPEEIRTSNRYRVQINFFIGGILNTYQQWMLGNLECAPEEIMDYIAPLIQSCGPVYLGLGGPSNPL